MKIADVFFRALLDDKDLSLQAVKVGDQMGQTLGQKMSTSLSSRLKGAVVTGGLTAFGAAAGIATKGLIELEDFQAEFIAQTGQSKQAAEEAGKAINEMSGRNLQPLHEIGDVLIGVTQNMQLTGDAANKMTEEILKFSTATGTDAVTNVKHFDDIIDAWKLNVEDAASVMDKLVVSHQRYGGSIDANLEALKGFAPQLQALGATIDDGIALLNLFSESGLDASASTRALNTAVKNLKPGQSLNDLIKQIASIQDPTERAQAAVKVFGARGGVGLANALRPGIDSLDSFKVSTTDAAGATDKAADEIESTIGNRIKLAFKAATSAIVGFGASFGPAATGLASLLTLATAFGGGKLIRLLAGGIAGAFRAAAASTAVTTAVAFASDAAATIYLKALFAGDALSAVVGRVWMSLIGSAPATAAIEAYGAFAGTTFGTAVIAAATAAIVAAPIVIAVTLIPKIQSGEFAPTLTPEQKTALGAFDAKLKSAGQDAGASAGAATATAFTTTAVDGVKGDPEFISTIADLGASVGEAGADAVAAGYTAETARTKDKIARANAALAKATGTPVASAFTASGRRMMDSIAKGITDARQAPLDALNTLKDMMKNALTPTAERSRLIGELASKELAQGLRSGDPAVRAEAQYAKQTIIDRLTTLGANTKNIGAKGMDELRKAMRSKDPDIKAAATAIYNAALGKGSGFGPADVPVAMTKYGEAAVDNFAAGMRRSFPTLRGTAQDAGAIVSRFFKGFSPTKEGPLSEDGGMGNWGRRLGLNFAAGFASSVPFVREASETVAAAAVPHRLSLPRTGLSAATVPSAVSVPGQSYAAVRHQVADQSLHVGTINVHLPDGNPSTARRAAHVIVDEMGKTFRQQGARIGLHPQVVP